MNLHVKESATQTFDRAPLWDCHYPKDGSQHGPRQRRSVMKRSRAILVQLRAQPRGEIRGIIHTHRPVSRQEPGPGPTRRFVTVIRMFFFLHTSLSLPASPCGMGEGITSSQDVCLFFIPLTAAYLGPCQRPSEELA